MTEAVQFTATDSGGQRLDSFVAAQANVSRSAAARLIGQGAVLLNGAPAHKSAVLQAGDIVTVEVPPPEPPTVQPEALPLSILYEDDSLLVVNKPKGMVVHPAAGHREGTMVAALLHHCGDSLSGIGGVIRPGIVHRLDKETAGLLVVAKHDAAHACLAAQIKEHSFVRQYEAIAYGRLDPPAGTIDAPVGRHPVKRKQMAVFTGKGLPADKGVSRPAVTHYETLGIYRYSGQAFSHLRLTLETGRTHQIRVHLAHIGHPVAGDPLYGPRRILTELAGQCLFAKRLGFIHPDGAPLDFEAPLPDWFSGFSNKMQPIDG